MPPTVSGTVTDSSGHATAWSASWTVGGASVRFPGDPGVGKVLVGNNGSPSADVPIGTFDGLVFTGAQAGKKASTVRIYNSSNTTISTSLRNELQGYANAGRIPMFSTKYGGRTAAQLATGSADADWDANANWLDSGYTGKMWYSPLGHEPENDASFSDATEKANYRAAYRRTVTRHVNILGASNPRIAYCQPWFMGFTYTNASNRDYRDWHPNWSGSAWLHDGPFDVLCADGSTYLGSWLHLDAIDLYNPQTGPVASDRNMTWADRIDMFLTKRENANQPPLFFSIGEYGLYDAPASLDDNGVTIGDILTGTLDTGAATDGLVGTAFWTNDNAFMNAASPKTGFLRTWVQDSRVIKI